MSDWPKETRYLSTRVPRVDGGLKVNGRAKYSSDVQPPGCLWGMILRANWPAARIQSINLDRARAMPGIKAAILVQELPRTVRFAGEELAAVAGTSRQACLDALRAIEVEAAPLPFVVTEEGAMKETAAAVIDGSPNVSPPRVTEQGNVDEAFAQADVIVEGDYSTQVEVHHPFETHGSTVAPGPDDTLTVWASTQGVFSVRDGLADRLELPQNKVRVISEFMGGGFGSKFGPGVEGVVAARLAREAGAPVKLMLSRFEAAHAVGNRPSSHQKIRLGARRDGTLVAYELDAHGTAGIGSGGETAGGGGGVAFPAPYIYSIPNTRVTMRGVAINAGPGRAFRAPGHPQASFGIEMILDELAVALGMDPIELRLKNDPFEIRQKEWGIAVERFGWKQKYHKPGAGPGPVKIGVGCGAATWPGGGRGTQAEVEISPDGSVEVRCGTQDLGTGTTTLVAIVAGEVFGIRPGAIRVRIGDTTFPPSGASGGSTTAASVCPAIYDTCTRAVAELKQRSGMEEVTGANWPAACRALGVQPLLVQGRWREGLSSSGVGGVQMAEVAVDTETGFVKVRRVLCVQDCGLVVNKLTCESQVNGGVIMGIGYALYENRIMDPETGVVLNPNFETYKLLGPADTPEIDIVLLEMPERGVIGVGEPVTIPTAAAVANAVANAIGVRITSLPITPDRVLAALGKIPSTGVTA